MSTQPEMPATSLDPRDRLRRASALAMTPAERMEVIWRLVAEAWAVLDRHPEGRGHFYRRNFRARSIQRAREAPADGS